MEFVKRNVGTHTPLLAGNSIYVDFLFLKVIEHNIVIYVFFTYLLCYLQSVWSKSVVLFTGVMTAA